MTRNIGKWLYAVFGAVFCGLFGFLAVDVIVNNRVPYYQYSPLVMTVFGVAVFAALVALGLVFKRLNLSRFAACETPLVAGALILYFIVQLAVGLTLQVEATQTWDFGIVFDAAYRQAYFGETAGEYFQSFPNNAPLYLVLAAFFRLLRLFGVENVMPFAVSVNALFINLSLLGMYLCARKLAGRKAAGFVLLCGFCFPVFLLYASIVYTDTVTMLFPVWSLYLYLSIRSAPFTRRSALQAAGIGLLCAVGGWIKITVLIVGIAILLDILLNETVCSRLKKAGCILLALVAVYAAANLYTKTSAALPQENRDMQYPYTHWVMMGLNGDGGYNDDDYKYTQQGTTYGQRVQLTQSEIVRRLSEMGAAGFLHHCADKLSFIFGDGLYYAPVKLDIRPVHMGNPLQEYCIQGMKHLGRTGHVAMGMQIALLAAICISAGWAVRSKENSLMVVRLAVFGVALFLLMWEARSRYLVNYLPLLLLAGLVWVPVKKK